MSAWWLRVGAQVKSNLWSMKRPKSDRLALPIDIPGRDGEGARFLQLYASGLVKLPPRILTTIERGEFKPVGEAFRKLLERYPFWQSLVAANPGDPLVRWNHEAGDPSTSIYTATEAFTSSQIIFGAGLRPPNGITKADEMRLAEVLRSLGFQRTKQSREAGVAGQWGNSSKGDQGGWAPPTMHPLLLARLQPMGDQVAQSSTFEVRSLL